MSDCSSNTKGYCLSKTSFCNGLQCPKMLWLDCYRKEAFDDSTLNLPVLEAGRQIGALARSYFGEFYCVPFSENVDEMVQDTEEAIARGEKVICEASFCYKNLFCSVDILINHGNGEFELYEVKSSKDQEAIEEVKYQDIAYQYYVLTGLGLNILSANLMRINSTYVRHGDIDVNQLFVIRNVTDEIIKRQADMKDSILNLTDFMNRYGEDQEPDVHLSAGCFKPYACGFFRYCSRNLPTPNVFDLRGVFGKGFNTAQKLKAYESGLVSFEDISHCRSLNSKQKVQIEYELDPSKGTFVDKKGIERFLDTLSYPLYFLDFETVTDGVPRFDDCTPYQQIPFQYSLHYINEPGGKIYHKEYLAWPGYDPRRELAEQLCRDIPMDVCTTAYNKSFEQGRIKDMAKLFPDLSKHLMNIHNNIRDLEDPFKDCYYYKREFSGKSSIKVVLPGLFPGDKTMDYSNLEGVHNGEEAINAYQRMCEIEDRTEIIRIRKQLLRYCCKDTYAMVGLLYKLYEAVGRSDYLDIGSDNIIEVFS